MIIGLDIDGVLADFVGGFRDTYQHHFDVELPEFRTWNDIFELPHFASMDALWDWTDNVPGFWENLESIPGAMGGVQILLEAGHELRLITNRHENCRAQTKAWVAKNWPGRVPEIGHTKNKLQVPANVYVDDSPIVLQQLADNGAVHVKFDQPWNRDVRSKLHAGNWHDLTLLLLEMGGAL